MLPNTLLAAVAVSVPAVSAAGTIMGFNYASVGNNQQSFEAQFNAASGLPISGFNSARLYTMIQDGTTNSPISAIPAAIATKSTLLLGLWASAGQANFDNEIAALTAAIKQYGSAFADAVVGISVGSEDLYRITDTSRIVNKDPNPGAEPETLISYIKQVRSAIKGTALADTPVGHVDTYTAYINGSNSAVIDNLDFLGMDAYPFYQTTVDNSIDKAYDLFWSAYDQTKSAGAGKPVWVTETGWPTSSAKSYKNAVASVPNAETYWQRVGCSLFGKTNVWWFDLADGGADPVFGVLGSSISNKPLYDLTCKKTSKAAVSSSSSSSASKTSSTSSAKTSGSSSSSSSKTTGTSSGSSSSTSSASSSSASSSSGSGSSAGTGSSSDSGSSAGTGSSSSDSGSGSSSSGTGTSSAAPSSFSSGAASHNVQTGGFAVGILGALAFLL